VLRAVVLAAGASTRMGRPKAGLRTPDAADTFLARVLRQLLDAGLPDIVVVTGAAAESVRAAAGRVRAPIRFEHNERWPDGQLSSLVAGLRDRRGDVVEAIMVALVDAPLVSVQTIEQVASAWRRHRAPIVRPARGDTHGHPVIFDATLFEQLRAADPRVGAKAVVRAHADRILNVEVDDPGAFIDIDTPQDYEGAFGGSGPPELRTKN
jgi:CTP:molybdopterin cytidylyltransferase MocA